VPAATPEPSSEPISEASLLGRIFERSSANFTPATAEYFLSIRFTDAEVSRMNELSDKAQFGSLSPAEHAELDSFIHVANFLALMQAKARRRLSSSAAM
jgi:hypothetical protein